MGGGGVYENTFPLFLQTFNIENIYPWIKVQLLARNVRGGGR